MKVKILNENHEHRGQLVPKGAVIDVSNQDAEWLIRDQVAETIEKKET